MPAVSSLFDLLNLSLGTPEVGAVNFKSLYALLHGILGHLNIQDLNTDRIAEDRRSDGSPPVVALPKEKPSSYPHMENRLQHIEEQMAALEMLPTGTELLSGTSSGTTLARDMWQQMQLLRKAQSNEDGVPKSMALIPDLLNEIRDLKESQGCLQNEVQMLREQQSQLNLNEQLDRISTLEKGCHQVVDLENVVQELQKKMELYPDPEELTQYITWDVLKVTLVREQLQQRSQSDGVPWQVSSGAERYPETMDALRHIGQLRERHSSLEVRVAQLETLKADQAQLQHLRELLTGIANKDVPDKLLEELNQLRTQTSGLMSDVQGAILQLHAECGKLQITIGHLVEEHSLKQKHIDELYKSVKQLQEKKADKDLVEMEIEIKADKQALETKVSQVQFDIMTEQLRLMFTDLLGKISGQEQDWNKVIEKISTEMESKLNRIELDPLKKQLEDRWKGIRKQLQAQPTLVLDDAAGIRKQLVARFHCLSCDRTVDMKTSGPQLVKHPTIPRGLPAHKSNRPSTVYELEQVRQHHRSDPIPESTDYSYPPMSRSCGGNHTLTYSNRRCSRLRPIAKFIQAEEGAQNSCLSGSTVGTQVCVSPPLPVTSQFTIII